MEINSEIISISKIKEGFFIGDQTAGMNFFFPIQFKITHMINAAGTQLPNIFEQYSIEYLTLHWRESSSQRLFDGKNKIAETIVNFIDNAISKGEGLLAFSVKGKNRVCIVVLIYLIKKFNWSLAKSMTFLKSKKKDVNIPKYFMEQLGLFEKKMNKEKKVTEGWDDEEIDNEGELMRNTYLNGLVISKKKKGRIQSKRKKSDTIIGWADNNNSNNNNNNTNGRNSLFEQIKDNEDLFHKKNVKDVTSHLEGKVLKSCIKDKKENILNKDDEGKNDEHLKKEEIKDNDTDNSIKQEEEFQSKINEEEMNKLNDNSEKKIVRIEVCSYDRKNDKEEMQFEENKNINIDNIKDDAYNDKKCLIINSYVNKDNNSKYLHNKEKISNLSLKKIYLKEASILVSQNKTAKTSNIEKKNNSNSFKEKPNVSLPSRNNNDIISPSLLKIKVNNFFDNIFKTSSKSQSFSEQNSNKLKIINQKFNHTQISKFNSFKQNKLKEKLNSNKNTLISNIIPHILSPLNNSNGHLFKSNKDTNIFNKRSSRTQSDFIKKKTLSSQPIKMVYLTTNINDYRTKKDKHKLISPKNVNSKREIKGIRRIFSPPQNKISYSFINNKKDSELNWLKTPSTAPHKDKEKIRSNSINSFKTNIILNNEKDKVYSPLYTSPGFDLKKYYKSINQNI